MQFEEFSECIKWFHPIDKRRENDQAWKVGVNEILKYDESGNLVSNNLDIKNPNSVGTLEHMPPEKFIKDIQTKERRIIEILDEIESVLAEKV